MIRKTRTHQLIEALTYLRPFSPGAPWQIIPIQSASAQENMAADEKILNETTQTNKPMIRFYTWKKRCVTFGRLLKEEEARKFALARETDEVVRRPTGGGFVLHENDISFSITWPRPLPGYPQKPQEAYRKIHNWIQQGLARLGYNFSFYAGCSHPDNLCFQSPVRNDLMDKNQKILGGAIRWTKKAVLYQGSLSTSFLDVFHNIPPANDFFGREIFSFLSSKNMRMPSDKLSAKTIDNIADTEPTGLSADFSVKNNL